MVRRLLAASFIIPPVAGALVLGLFEWLRSDDPAVVGSAFVAMTTSTFSRPYMRTERDHGKMTPPRLRLYHSMYQLFTFTMLLALTTWDWDAAVGTTAAAAEAKGLKPVARIVGHSAHVRSGLIGREEAAKEIEPPPDCSMDQVFMLMKRWGFDQTQFEDLMTLPFHTYREYDNYKPIFEKYRPFFYLLAKAELIPMSFYVKYTSKDNI